MSTETKILYGQSEENIALETALIHVAGNFMEGAIGLFYSPQACRFGQIQTDGSVEVVDGKSGEPEPLDLTQVFEARIFNATAELRWLNVLGQGGKGILLSEHQFAEKYFSKPMEMQYYSKLEQTYLLWGEPISRTPPPHWNFLATARIGTLAVPIPGEQKDYVVLNSCEYLKVGECGNVAIVQERLINLTWESKDESN